jgi:hypothetical protein
MNRDEFQASLVHEEPPHGLSAPLQALWWDAKQVWTRAHTFVDKLGTTDGMAVHAYLHCKEDKRQTRTIGINVQAENFIAHALRRMAGAG